MIRGERVIQINMALLVVTGALLLSIAQNHMTVFLITTLLVTLALVVVDGLKWFSFHPFLANSFAFVLTLVTFSQFIGGNAGTKLNAVANLLTYLQLILLLQKKNPRLYWQVMMLSLLQVVVAAALNLDFGAGLAFFGYVILVVVGSIHLKIYRGNYRLREEELNRDRELEKFERGDSGAGFLGVATFRASSLDFRNEKKIAWQGFLLCVCSLVFAFTIFFSIPRFDRAWYGPSANPIQQTGFTTEIRFDDHGFLQESNRTVLRASFLDQDERPMELAIEPYFKGLTLTDYAPDENGAWTWTNTRNQKPGRRGQGARTPPRPRNDSIEYMKQVIRLEAAGKVPISSNVENHLLFSVFPVYQTSRTPADLVYNRRVDVLFRDASVSRQSENGPYRYELLVPLYRKLGQLPAVPVSFRFPLAAHNIQEEINRLQGKTYDRFDEDWSRIRALGRRLIQEIRQQTGVESPDRRVICNQFVNYLKRNEFTYSRDLGSIDRDPDEDPIVDFLFNHRTGHCEYYATALALMLRSQGIPCRIISGFRGGDYNALGGFYVVKEKHAHVWVEAFLRPGDCDQSMIETGQADQFGAWLRLDPTPGSNGSTRAAEDSLVDRAFDAVGFARKLWDDYIMGLDKDSRQFNGFDPTDPDLQISRWMSGLREGLSSLLQNNGRPNWSVWIAVVVVPVGIVFLGAFFVARKQLKMQGRNVTAKSVLAEMWRRSVHSVNAIRQRWTPAVNSADPDVPDFFREYLRLLTGMGFRRAPQETQLEFAARVANTIARRSSGTDQGADRLIDRIVSLYYRGRFGGTRRGVDRPTIEQQGQELVRKLADRIGTDSNHQPTAE